MKMPRLLVGALVALAMPLGGCTAMGAALTAAGGGAPPQAPAQVTKISRTALDFALNSFDAALFGLDFAMDAGVVKPGSAQAKGLAAAGRKVMSFLGAAEAARELGNSATYEEAFAHANDALKEFRQLLGKSGVATLSFLPDNVQLDREKILRRVSA